VKAGSGTIRTGALATVLLTAIAPEAEVPVLIARSLYALAA